MFSLTFKVAQSVARYGLVIFPLILLILAIGVPTATYVRTQLGTIREKESELETLAKTQLVAISPRRIEGELKKFAASQAETASSSVEEFKNSSVRQLQGHANVLQRQLALKNNEREALVADKSQLGGMPLLGLFPDPERAIREYVEARVNLAITAAKVDVEREVLTQEISYLRKLLVIQDGDAKCQDLDRRYGPVWDQYRTLMTAYQAAIQQGIAPDDPRLEGARKQIDELAPTVRTSADAYISCRSILAKIDSSGKKFSFDSSKLSSTVREATALVTEAERKAIDRLEKEKEGLTSQINGNLVNKFMVRPIKAVFWTAIWILAGVILIPKLIRALLYGVVVLSTPRRAAICLLPGAQGAEQLVGQRTGTQAVSDASSGVSVRVMVIPGFELLVQQQYFESAPHVCRTKSRALLDWKQMFMSVSAGLYNLTAVECAQQSSVVLSSGVDLLDELAVIDVPVGSALSVRPAYLAGVLQRIDTPMRVEGKWQLSKLQAWLTGQLRYYIFHGPVQLIVRGGRGVRVEEASAGGTVPQVKTIGFSANLRYSVCAAEALMPYIAEKKPLLRDRFAGRRGVFLYEEMPTGSKRSGVTGRGLEGLMDAALKVVGI